MAFSKLLLSETDDHVICDCDDFGSFLISYLYLFPSVGALAVIYCTVLVRGEERQYPGFAPDFRETTQSSNVTAALALLIAFP